MSSTVPSALGRTRRSSDHRLAWVSAAGVRSGVTCYRWLGTRSIIRASWVYGVIDSLGALAAVAESGCTRGGRNRTRSLSACFGRTSRRTFVRPISGAAHDDPTTALILRPAWLVPSLRRRSNGPGSGPDAGHLGRVPERSKRLCIRNWSIPPAASGRPAFGEAQVPGQRRSGESRQLGRRFASARWRGRGVGADMPV